MNAFVIVYKILTDWELPNYRDIDFVILFNEFDVVHWIIANQNEKEIIYIIEVKN